MGQGEVKQSCKGGRGGRNGPRKGWIPFLGSIFLHSQFRLVPVILLAQAQVDLLGLQGLPQGKGEPMLL